MDSSYTTPILLATGLHVASQWYQGHGISFRALLGGGFAVLVGGVIAQVPGMAPVVAGIAWVAFAGVMVAGPRPTPADTIVSIVGGK